MKLLFAALVVGVLAGCTGVGKSSTEPIPRADDIIGHWTVETVWDGRPAKGVLRFDADGFYRFELTTTLEGHTEYMMETVGLWRLKRRNGAVVLVLNDKETRCSSVCRIDTEHRHSGKPIKTPRVYSSDAGYEVRILNAPRRVVLSDPGDDMTDLVLRRKGVSRPDSLPKKAGQQSQ
ncbi:MAG: hypothetical protein HRF45_12750 [Fimbriimonadia bacterium]